MPNIKEFNAGSGEIHPSELGSTAYEQLGRHVSADFNQAGSFIGSGIAKVGDQFEEQDARAETVQMYQDLSNVQIQAHQSLSSAISQGDPNDHTLLAGWKEKSLDPMFDKLADKYSNPLVKARFEEERARMTSALADRGLGMQADLAGKVAVANYKQFYDQQANSVSLDPASVSMHADQSDRFIQTLADSQAIPQALVKSEQSKGRATIFDASADSIAHNIENTTNVTPQQIEQVKGILADPKNGYSDNMSPGKFQETMDRLNHAQKLQVGVQGQIAAQAFPQVIDQIKTNGGIDVKGQGQAIINGYQGETPRETALKRAEMQRDLDAATTVGTSIKGVKEMPDADAQQFVRDVQARINVETDPDKLKGLEETLKGAQETITKRDEQFKKDPAGYVLNNSAPTSNAYATFTKNPSPASFSAYAQASSAEQRRMYPDHVPSLVTADMAAQASAVVRSITQGPEGSAGAAKQLQDMSKMYGQYWPTIAQDLMHRKVFDGDQYVAAALYSKPEAQGISEQILAASAMKNGELFNQHGVTDGAARHSAIEALQPLQASLGNANNGGELMSSYVNALTHVIQYTSTDKNNLVDAGVIANKMILDEFKFVGPGGTLRVPTSQNADAISSGAESVLDAIDKHDLVVPPSAGALGPTAQKANWIHQLQMTGRWFSNEDGSGALLYDQDGHNVMEMRNGRRVPVELNWKDLTKLGS